MISYDHLYHNIVLFSYFLKFLLFYFFVFKIKVLKLLNKNTLIPFFHFRNLVTTPDGTRMLEKQREKEK